MSSIISFVVFFIITIYVLLKIIGYAIYEIKHYDVNKINKYLI